MVNGDGDNKVAVSCWQVERIVGAEMAGCMAGVDGMKGVYGHGCFMCLGFGGAGIAAVPVLWLK